MRVGLTLASALLSGCGLVIDLDPSSQDGGSMSMPCVEGAECQVGIATCERGVQRCPEGGPPFCEATGDARSAGEECRPMAGPCDVAEVCDGASTECPSDELETVDVECRGRAGECDVAESCTGTSPECPGDTVVSSGEICRESAGECDVAEACTGLDPECPSDGFQPSTVVCRGSAGDCDAAENCDGSSPRCPADAGMDGVECRPPSPSDPECDTAEVCIPGVPTCPANAFAPVGMMCMGGVCNGLGNCMPCVTGAPCSTGNPCEYGEIECDGVVRCTHRGYVAAGTICRAAVGACDQPESCLDSGVCPSDALFPGGTYCGTSSTLRGGCDVLERCDGMSPSCPAETVLPSGWECRGATGSCDEPEVCNGVSVDCPRDDLAPMGTPCRAVAGVCDIEETCSGTSPSCPTDMRLGASTVCRAATRDCDVAETCGTNGPDCAGDSVAPDGTRCGNASCGDRYQCSSGLCQLADPLAPTDCRFGEICCQIEGCAPLALMCLVAS